MAQPRGLPRPLPESFASRGLKSICETPNRERTVHEADRRADVYAAAAWFKARADVDASRLAVLGWSHGAQTVLHTIDRSAPFVASRPLPLRAAVAYYPGCSAILKQNDYALATPLLLMVGENDDWTPAAPCQNSWRVFQQRQRRRSSLPPTRTATTASTARPSWSPLAASATAARERRWSAVRRQRARPRVSACSTTSRRAWSGPL